MGKSRASVSVGDELSGSPTALYESTKESFFLKTRGRLFTVVLTFSILSMALGCVIRSCIVIADNNVHLEVLAASKISISLFKLVEVMTDLVLEENLARSKYLTTNFDPRAYAEMNDAVTELNILFTDNSWKYSRIYFRTPEYRKYYCSFYEIRSNLQQRPEAVPLTQYRGYDEHGMSPWEDADYYWCLVNFLSDLMTQLLNEAVGFETRWQVAAAYFMTWESKINLKLATNYAHLIRQLVLTKGSLVFSRESDVAHLKDSVNIAVTLIRRALELNDDLPGLAGARALRELRSLVQQVVNSNNATIAYLLVSKEEEFELTSFSTNILDDLANAKEAYMQHLVVSNEKLTESLYYSLISEAAKLFIVILIIPPFYFIGVKNMAEESTRMLSRYDSSIDRYADSCKAVFRLMPEPVAKKLNSGSTVKPEYFHNVSVLYSDIVGFTTICSKLTASQVLTMLNCIYTTFDNLTNVYGCYKIETIGDAYVVASGVPNRNQNHSSQISLLATVLLEEVTLLKIPRAANKIRIRLGICSGPVIAGIVGVKMLRYCLFGKTVLTANRMEQTSQPQRIQVSKSCFHELQSQGGFIMTQRPQDEWPDGEPTYWLNGQISNSAPLSLFYCSEIETHSYRIVLN